MYVSVAVLFVVDRGYIYVQVVIVLFVDVSYMDIMLPDGSE